MTDTLIQSGEEAKAEASQAKEDQLDEAANALKELVQEREQDGDLLLKKQAETFLCKEQELKQRETRKLIKDKTGVLWQIIPVPKTRGNAKALISVNTTPPKTPSDDRNTDDLEPGPDKGSRGTISVNGSQQGRPNYQPASPSDTRPRG